MSTVEYRDIPDFPGYRVGNDGTVWSRWSSGGGTRSLMNECFHQLKPTPRRGGYLFVNLCHYGKRQQRSVHRLVLEAFVGLCPTGMECCHFPDRNPANNRLSNLRWGTVEANAADMVQHGTRAKGNRHGLAKLTTEKVLSIRTEHNNGHSPKDIAQKYGVHEGTINSIVARRTWKHVV